MYTSLKISFRHLFKNRLYATINIIGLATGIACVLLAVLYWKDECSFDTFHKNNPNLYRVTTNLIETKGGKRNETGGTGQVQGPAFQAGVPEVKSYARILGGDIYSDISAGNKVLHLQSFFVDHNFFDVFSFRLLQGNPTSVLRDINAVVVTESTAKKFFNTIDVVGKPLLVNADPSFERLGKPLVISGVVEDPPRNSSLQFDVLFTFDFLHLAFEDTAWLNAYLGTFVVLQPGAEIKVVTKKFDKIYSIKAKKQLADKFTEYDFDPQIHYGLQRITDIHFNPLMSRNGNAESGVINGSSPFYSYMFMGIAFFILLMAAINFVNINIGNSLGRAKEVGVRKVSGGSKWQIVLQFLNESAILCFIAFLLSLLLVNFTMPLFNKLTGKQLLFSTTWDGELLLYFLGVLGVIILLTGCYPAYVLSNFKASEVLYNRQKLSGRNVMGRGLVVIQFSLAVFLLIATIIYYRQMDYIGAKDLGYNPNQVIRTGFGGDRDYESVANYLKNELAQEPSIKMVSFGNDGWNEDVVVNGQVIKTHYKKIDENFIPALEIPLKAGRNLSPVSNDIREGVIVNEAFVIAARLTDAIGTSLKINRDDDSTIKIIRGVVKDFHFGSLREWIKPMVMHFNEPPDGGMWVRFEKKRQKEAMASLERIYHKVLPDAVYQYNFLDELNARQYFIEQRWQLIIGVATILAFVICCLGLLGLAHISTTQRIKEIGVRKVLGASVRQVVSLLSADFLKLVIIAFLIAAPVSWMVADKWLENFAYRINIGWWVFAFAAFLSTAVALATVSLQAIKASFTNPVISLRNE